MLRSVHSSLTPRLPSMLLFYIFSVKCFIFLSHIALSLSCIMVNNWEQSAKKKFSFFFPTQVSICLLFFSPPAGLKVHLLIHRCTPGARRKEKDKSYKQSCTPPPQPAHPASFQTDGNNRKQSSIAFSQENKIKIPQK